MSSTWQRKSEIWKYFIKIDAEEAKCCTCSVVIKCKGSSTSAMISHLKSMHQINVIKDKSSTVTTNTIAPKKTVLDSFIKRQSLEAIVAELASKDNITIRAITNSRFIRESISARGHYLPKDESQVKNLIIKFYEQKKTELMDSLQATKQNGGKFSVTLDEWTSLRNTRYFNINLHGNIAACFNLGLVPIAGSCNAEQSIQLVTRHLQEFQINFKEDVVAATNDGAAVILLHFVAILFYLRFLSINVSTI